MGRVALFFSSVGLLLFVALLTVDVLGAVVITGPLELLSALGVISQFLISINFLSILLGVIGIILGTFDSWNQPPEQHRAATAAMYIGFFSLLGGLLIIFAQHIAAGFVA